jgi:predicted NAD/FAD-dependent oxidoreductase
MLVLAGDAFAPTQPTDSLHLESAVLSGLAAADRISFQ